MELTEAEQRREWELKVSQIEHDIMGKLAAIQQSAADADLKRQQTRQVELAIKYHPLTLTVSAMLAGAAGTGAILALLNYLRPVAAATQHFSLTF